MASSRTLLIARTSACASRAREPARRAPRRDARTKQRLARVNVADPDDHVGVHDELLDGDRALARRAIQILAVELRGQRLGTELRKQRMLERIARRSSEGSRSGADRESAGPCPSRSRDPSDRAGAAAHPAETMRRLPDMPRCTMSVPVSEPISRYFARRSTRRTSRPRIALSIFASIGQRKRRSRTRNAATRLPTRAGAMPRRVVSTSGSSGRSYLIFDSL